MATSHVTPGQARHLRACMVCSIVQLQSRFLREGCPNCDSVLQMSNDPEMVGQCTSQVYEGLITIANPADSWVAKWQRIDKYVPGVYAVKVVGSLSGNVIQMLEDAGVRYVPRDGSAEEEV